MNNDLILKSSLPGSLYPERAITDLLESFVRRIQYDHADITLDRLPTEAERKQLQARQREVATLLRAAELASAEREKAIQAVSLLYAQYTNMRDPAETAEGIAITLAKELPLWAIVKACDDVYHGRIYDEDKKTGARKYLSPDFPVTGIRLAQVAGAYCAKLRDEKVNLGNVLSCNKVRPSLPDNRDRVVVPRMPVMSEAQSFAEKHHQEQRAKTREKMAEAEKRGRERTILMLYKRMGIAPKRTAAGELIHPEIIDHDAWDGQESARDSDV